MNMLLIDYVPFRVPFHMNDQEIMDVLLEKFGEEAVEQFGNCLSDVINPLDMIDDGSREEERAMLAAKVNAVLEGLGSSLRVVWPIACDGDYYLWEMQAA